MIDSLHQNITAITGIPDLGNRLMLIGPVIFVILVAIVLVYFKKKEVDEKAGI